MITPALKPTSSAQHWSYIKNGDETQPMHGNYVYGVYYQVIQQRSNKSM
jgi:hypothetical protein